MVIFDVVPIELGVSLNNTQLWYGKLQDENHTALPVIIKQLMPNHSAVNYTQFVNEVTVLKNCQSLAIEPHSLTTYGVAKLHGANSTFEEVVIEKNNQLHTSPFFVMSYYQGNTLKNLIHHHSLSFIHKISLFIAICEVTQRLHRLGYIHCDLKPSNFLITLQSQLVLLDFGLTISSSHLSESNLTAGTPAYMSPEQFTGRLLTSKSDFYSLGIIFFELLTGKLPFNAKEVREWALAHCQQPIPLLETYQYLSSQQCLDCQPIIDGLLAKNPHNRFANLDEVMKLLTYIL